MSPADDTVIDEAQGSDLADIAALAQARRLAYQAVQPQFWQVADDAVARHTAYLAALIDDPDVVTLVARSGRHVQGFAVASLAAAPPVYRPGGPTAFVDDFAVAEEHLWQTAGRALLHAVRERMAQRGAAQIVVVCGHHDQAKMSALLASGLRCATEWLVAPVLDGAAPAD